MEVAEDSIGSGVGNYKHCIALRYSTSRSFYSDSRPSWCCCCWCCCGRQRNSAVMRYNERLL